MEINMKRYLSRVKKSALNLFNLEKPMTRAEWVVYIVEELDSKIDELYESGELDYYNNEFNPNPDITYALNVVRDNLNSKLNLLSKYSPAKYNAICKKVADDYVDTLIKKELAKGV